MKKSEDDAVNTEPLLRMNIQLSLEDYKHYNYFHHRLKLPVFAAYLFILFIVTSLVSGAGYRSLPILILIGLAISAVFSGIYMMSWGLQAKRVFKSNAIVQREQEVHFTEQGVTIISPNGTSLIQWNEIHKVTESNKIFTIYIAQNQGLIIPKRCGDPNKIREIIKANIEQKKLKLR